jgi:hypothetical protein
VTAPPTRADLIAGSGGRHCGRRDTSIDSGTTSMPVTSAPCSTRAIMDDRSRSRSRKPEPRHVFVPVVDQTSNGGLINVVPANVGIPIVRC